MRFRLPSTVALFAALILSVPSSGSPGVARAQRASGAKDELIFLVTRRPDGVFEFEPIAAYKRGSYVGAISGESGEADLARFGREYYRAGTRYRLMWGGAEAGTVIAKASQKGSECSRASATADVQTTVRIGGNLMALATNSPKFGRPQTSRRAPTDAERAQTNEQVRAIFRQKGVPESALDGVKTINLTATDTDGDGAAELIGSFMVRHGAGLVDQLFLLAEPSGNSFKAGIERHEQFKVEDLPDPEAIESVGQSAFLTEVLIDQLDVDGDGTGEVFTVSYSFEGTHYAIYKKGAKGWTRIQEFYNYRCAY